MQSTSCHAVAMDTTSLHAKRRAHRDLPPPALRRALREDAGLSQDDIAATMGVHRETVSRWERGLRTPRGDSLLNYVSLLGELRDGQ